MGVVMGKMPRYVYCGIDPGKTGGMAFLSHDKSKPPILFPFTNKTPWDIHDFLEEINPSYHLIEKVAGSTGGIQGRTSGRSMFTFGWNAGFLYGLLVKRSLAEITPSQWQKEFKLTRTNKKESDGDKKRRHAVKAQRLFPQQKVSQQMADALLIACYCRRYHEELF